MTIVYRNGNNKLNRGETVKVIDFLRKLASTAKPEDSDVGICYNLDEFLFNMKPTEWVKLHAFGYDIVAELSVGFPNVRMDETEGKTHLAHPYPIGFHKSYLWEVGNERTKLCTHIANRLEDLLYYLGVTYDS